MGIFYLPADGACGDFIPYYNAGRECYELYYLHDSRGYGGEGEGTSWRRIITRNMAHFTEEGEILKKGTAQEQDLFCYTGCVVQAEELYHIFYTGHNYHFAGTGKPQEAVMHAVSADGVNWEKQPEDTFYAPEDREEIERDDWRDPFVFYREEEQRWWMLLCTRKKAGASRRRGATGLLTSEDLRHWTYQGSYWEPHVCWCPECPDLFQWGEHWYFVYSTFHETEGLRTWYRIAESPRGPWRRPACDSFDGRAFYAGKTASDGKNRYLFGWNPTKTDNRDEGVWQWGGNLTVHKLTQEADGSLTVSMPEAVRAVYGKKRELTPRGLYGTFCPEEISEGAENDRLREISEGAEYDRLGETSEGVRDFWLEEASGGAAALTDGVSGECMLEFELFLSEGTDSAGIQVKAGAQGEQGYYIRLEPGRGRLVFDREPAYPHEKPEIERFVKIGTECWHKLSILLDGSCLLAYLDDKYALSARMYDFDSDRVLFFVNDGKASFRGLCLRESV